MTSDTPTPHAPASALIDLACGWCGDAASADKVWTVCGADGRPYLARYDLDRVRAELTPAEIATRPGTMWRYAELLPVRDPAAVVSLGEGWTPLLELGRLGASLGADRLLAKDEGRNPTGSFKARGMAAAVSRARELGARVVATPSAGNAGAAMAAYAARAGLTAVVAMPADAPRSAQAQVLGYGGRLLLVDGLIGDAGRLIAGLTAERGWANVATLREPYRAEGKKTLGLELAEQLGQLDQQLSWRVPDVVVYPTGGGTGIVGMWKAWAELEQLGWIGSKRPRIVAVQAVGCAPIVRAFEIGERTAEPWAGASTSAAGLRVPSAVGDFLILDAIRESEGFAVAVTDAEMVGARDRLARLEGLDVSLEAAATLAGFEAGLSEGRIASDEEVVLFLTGSGLLEPAPAAGSGASLPIFAPDDVAGAGRFLDAAAD
jgi:threonine synthase